VSAVMRGNKKRDTRPELALRRALHARGLRYRVDYALGFGRRRADIAFTRRRVVVFVDGCFWHCCPEHGTTPRANVAYWEPKLRRNVERDHETDARLRETGWSVVRIWEHEPVSKAVERIEFAIGEHGVAAIHACPAR
jgi:DNA mismatch endonuclease (patch repair protein)